MSDASTGESRLYPNTPIRRDHPLVARILRRWRQLSGGKQARDTDRRTLVACSGGADSVALAISLAQNPGSCVLAHIEHDIRDPQSTGADRELVESLAKRFGVPFVHNSAPVREQSGNLEANARDARYKALSKLAQLQGCPYIATGHHADDQLETLLMHLMRGSGTRGMGGMRPSVELGSAVLLRPLLRISRTEIEIMLREFGIQWRHDTTNDDPTLNRNRVRQDLLPLLRRMDPDIALHASNWASDLSAMQGIIDQQVEIQLLDACTIRGVNWSWSRTLLKAQPDLLLGYLPGLYVHRVLDGHHADHITRRAIESWLRSMKSDSTDPSEHQIGPIVSQVLANEVCFSPTNGQGTSK